MIMINGTRNHKSLAVFICGKTSGTTKEVNGDYIDIYKRFLTASLEAHTRGASKASNLGVMNHHGLSSNGNGDDKADSLANGESASHPLWQFTLDAYDVFEKQELPTEEKLDDYDGIFISGSPASAYDDLPWINNLVALIKHVAETKPSIKLIGICFGHQIIARALGGACVPNNVGWEVGPTSIDLTPLGRCIFGTESINLEEMHRDHVPADRVPPGFEILGSTGKSANQGMVRFLPSRSLPTVTPSYSASSQSPDLLVPHDHTVQPLSQIQIFSVQGHPEWNERVLVPLVEERRATGVIPIELADDALERLEHERKGTGWANHGAGVVGGVIWGILGVEV